MVKLKGLIFLIYPVALLMAGCVSNKPLKELNFVGQKGFLEQYTGNRDEIELFAYKHHLDLYCIHDKEDRRIGRYCEGMQKEHALEAATDVRLLDENVFDGAVRVSELGYHSHKRN